MWFKNCLFYRLSPAISWDENQLQQQLAEQAFSPCGKREPSQYGWVAPLNGAEQLSFWGGACFMLCARKEEKILPTAVVKEKLAERVALIEEREQRKVYRKEQQNLKEEIVHDCLPQAFTRSSHTYAYVDTKNHWLCVDASSHAKAENLIKLLRDSLGSLPLQLPQVADSPALVMSQWLRGEGLPDDIVLGQECELREAGEAGSIIRCKNQDLLSDEIEQHLLAGKQVVKLALNWQDSLQLVLADDLSLKRLKFSEQLLSEAEEASGGDNQARFDADFALLHHQFARLLPQLLDWFGGAKDEPV
ncbi:MAG: recombination-associated protein RdgC [Cellvibrionaceae bacterium]|nr:recombination-associated protein RdgC [Cellvibrionaceae bacterium]